MIITKSHGTTPTERLLASFCEDSFLTLWSYPNPVKETDGDELCDLIAVFENNIFIFFDKGITSLERKDVDIQTKWKRWKKRSIDKQIRTAHGAEKYIRSSKGIYLDPKRKIPFPIMFDHETAAIHKIIIAHGAKEACENASGDNVSGSLAIAYSDPDNHPSDLSIPFIVDIDRTNPVHVLDSNTLPIILKELDTFHDFAAYLNAKVDAINRHDTLIYCGEEDLLADYYQNFDDDKNSHFIGVKGSKSDGIGVAEGAWERFIQHPQYQCKKEQDKNSYFWDTLIQKTGQNIFDERTGGNSKIFEGKSAIYEMAKEPRFSRRALSQNMIEANKSFPDFNGGFARNVSFMPSFYPDVGYVYLQVMAKESHSDNEFYENEYLPIRREILEIACGAAKNKFKNLKKVIGIGVDAPRHCKRNAEDFILLECADWPSELEEQYFEGNKTFNFFETGNMQAEERTIQNFPTVSS